MPSARCIANTAGSCTPSPATCSRRRSWPRRRRSRRSSRRGRRRRASTPPVHSVHGSPRSPGAPASTSTGARRGGRPVNLDDVSAAHPSLVTAGPDVEQGYDAWAVRQAIDDLPDDERAVVRLQHVEGLSHVEIAEQLGVPVGTVKSRSFRAHRRLAAALGHLRQPERRTTPDTFDPPNPEPSPDRRTYSRMTGEPMNDDDRIAYLAGEPTGSIDDMDDARRSRRAPGVAGRSRVCGTNPRRRSRTRSSAPSSNAAGTSATRTIAPSAARRRRAPPGRIVERRSPP